MSELLRLHLKGEPKVRVATDQKTYLKPFSIWETLARGKIGGRE
ncbi:MAG: hypothetical protein WCX79_00150 [Candidatus Paceibacterota bacterium]|jgi:hypothetical protein